MPTVRYRILRVGTELVFDMPAWAAMCESTPSEVTLPNGKAYKVQRAMPGRNQIDLMIEVPADELWSVVVGESSPGRGRPRKKHEEVA